MPTTPDNIPALVEAIVRDLSDAMGLSDKEAMSYVEQAVDNGVLQFICARCIDVVSVMHFCGNAIGLAPAIPRSVKWRSLFVPHPTMEGHTSHAGWFSSMPR